MIACVFGRRGSGKTTWLRRALAPRARLLVHDPMVQHVDTCHVSEERETTWQRVQRPTWRVAHVPKDDTDAEWLALLAVAAGDCTLAYDEAGWSFGPNVVPDGLKRAVGCSRHFRLDILAAAQRPAMVPRVLTGQADAIVLFHLSEPRDLLYVREHCGPEVAAAVTRLQPFHFVQWTPTEWMLCQPLAG